MLCFIPQFCLDPLHFIPDRLNLANPIHTLLINKSYCHFDIFPYVLVFADMVPTPKNAYTREKPSAALRSNNVAKTQQIILSEPGIISRTDKLNSTTPVISLISRSAIPRFCFIYVNLNVAQRYNPPFFKELI